MPSHTLDLGEVLLTDSPGKFQLSATFTASLQLPQSIATSNHTDILKALTSGHIWTTRGIGCSFNITIMLDGKPLDKTQRSALVESLGRRLNDTEIWPQLSLLPSLGNNTAPDLQYPRPDISIGIKYGPTTSTKSGPRGCLLDKTDVIPPKDVLRVDMERIQLQLDFLTNSTPSKAQTEVKIIDQDEDLDLLLLDQFPANSQSDHLVQLEDAVRSIKKLPDFVTNTFNRSLSHLSNYGKPRSSLAASMSVTGQSLETVSSRSTSVVKQQGPSGNKRLPIEAVAILKEWLESHASNPYPSRVQKEQLLQQTGLTNKQINTWLYYARRKQANDSTQHTEQEMLFSMPASEYEPPKDDDPTDLLSQFSDDTPSLLSQPSTSSNASESLLVVPFKRFLPGKELDQTSSPLLDSPVAGKLVDAALQTLIGGYYPQIRLPKGITIERPTPERTLSQASLSQLVPTMFNPDYRQLMAHNSRFLPTITNALAVTLPKNVQSPTLRKKLETLATLPFSPLIPDPEPSENLDPSERISRVVQTRLFSMMQRTLYDPSATRKIFKKSNTESSTTDIPSAEDSDSSPDLLDNQNSEEREGGKWDEMLAQFSSDDEFDDLLGREADDDDCEFGLLDEAEKERLAIERETDEMLLGGGWGEDWVGGEDDDFLLSGGESENEGMLL